MPKPRVPAHFPDEVGQQDLCEFWQLSTATLHKFTKAGMPKADYGKYPFQECNLWLLDHYRQAAPKRREMPSTEAARKVVYEETAEKYRLENEVRRGELIELEDVRQFLLLLGASLAGRLDGLPARLTNDPVLRSKALDECRALQSEISLACENCELVQVAGESAETASGEDSSGVGASASDHAEGDAVSGAVA